DGYLDIVSYANPPGRSGAGGVAVVSGCNGLEFRRDLAAKPPDLSVYGRSPSDGLATGLAVGDVDGDGRADMFLGAPGSQSFGGARGSYTGEADLILGRAFDAACTVSADAGPDLRLCEGASAPIVLDGSATGVSGCTQPGFRWS